MRPWGQLEDHTSTLGATEESDAVEISRSIEGNTARGFETRVVREGMKNALLPVVVRLRPQLEDRAVIMRAASYRRAVEVASRVEDGARIGILSVNPTGEVIQHDLRPSESGLNLNTLP